MYSRCSYISNTVACQKGIDKHRQILQSQFRLLLQKQSELALHYFRVFPICYSDKHFLNFSPDNLNFIWKQKEKSILKFLSIYHEYCFSAWCDYVDINLYYSITSECLYLSLTATTLIYMVSLYYLPLHYAIVKLKLVSLVSAPTYVYQLPHLFTWYLYIIFPFTMLL